MQAISAELEQVTVHLSKAQAHLRELADLAGLRDDPTTHRTIRLTQGGINNSYIPLSDVVDFFPQDSVGAPNAKDGLGRLLTLHFDGLSRPLKTDIPSDKRQFRQRGDVGEFFRLHGLAAGDALIIERLAEDEYRIRPAP